MKFFLRLLLINLAIFCCLSANAENCNYKTKLTYIDGTSGAETCDRHLFVNLADVWVAAPKIEPDQTSVLCNTGFSTLQIQ
jgi:hypothetical protein